MRKILFFKTKVGTFYISISTYGQYHAFFGDQDLGGYTTIQQAIDDLVGGHTFSLSGGIDSSKQDLPGDASDWEIIDPR